MRISTKLAFLVAFFLSVLSFSFSLCPAGELIPPTRTFQKTGKGLGKLTISSDPPGLEVLLDGMAVGKTPVWIRQLKPGVHRVRIKDLEKDICVEPHRTSLVTLSKGSLVSIFKKADEEPEIAGEQLNKAENAIEPTKEQMRGDLTSWERFLNRSSQYF